MPEFERRHPGVHVVVQQIPFRTAHEKILTAFVGGNTPDLGQIGNSWIPELALLGAIVPLEPRLAGSRTVAAADYFPGIWATNVVEGALYGIPWYVDTRLFFYRRDLLAAVGLARPPRSWSELHEALRRLKARAGPEHFAALLPTDEFEQPLILGMQTGAPLLRDGDRYGDFAEPRFRRALEFYVSLFHEGLAPLVSNAQVGNLYQQFAQGHFAMYPSGPWNLGEFRRRLPAALQDAWATAPMPAPDGAPYPGASFAGGSSLALFRSCRHPREAWQLVEYLSEEAQQLRFWRLTGDLPARLAAWADPQLAADPRTQAFRVQLENVRPTPAIPEWQQIAIRLHQAAQEAILRTATPAQALASLDRDVDQILEKRRWLLERRSQGARGAAGEPAPKGRR
jgi:multiple sugar transport system substrate-binding protein